MSFLHEEGAAFHRLPENTSQYDPFGSLLSHRKKLSGDLLVAPERAKADAVELTAARYPHNRETLMAHAVFRV